jgi:hypothetical protein
MTDRAKFEQMLELLINEDKEKAQELFHELVVAKSREIYENLLDDDMQVDQQTSEDFGVSEVSDDKADDELDDIEADDAEDEAEFGDEEGDEEEGSDEPATKDDLDLMKQDIIDELTAEFEAMMAGGNDSGADDMGADDMGMGGDDMGMDEPKEEDFVLEYVEKVGTPKMGDNGANAKSIVAGKNDMGGTTGNIVKGGESKGEGTKGGLLNPATKDLNSGNVNTPGSKNATKLSSVAKGHGAEKKGSGDNGANTKSTLGS